VRRAADDERDGLDEERLAAVDGELLLGAGGGGQEQEQREEGEEGNRRADACRDSGNGT